MKEAVCRWIDHRGMAACLVMTVALRGAMMWSAANGLTQDRDAYLGIARSVAAGRGFCNPDSPVPTAFRPPAYPLQLAGLMLVFSDATAVALVNLFWSTTCVWATIRTGRMLDLGPYGVLAGAIVAVDPLLTEYSTQAMTEVTCAGLVSLLLLWIVRRDGRESLQAVVIGLLFGALVLCRPTFWPFAGILGLVMWLKTTAGQTTSLRMKSFLNVAFCTAIGIAAFVGPWVVRNQVVMGAPILTTTHGGYTLLLGNNPVFYGDVVEKGWGTPWEPSSFDKWQSDLHEDLRRNLGPDASELDQDRWQGRHAWEFIRAEPRRFLHAVWYRVRSLWSPVPQREAASRLNSWLVVAVGWYYAAVLLAFVTGMIVVAVRRGLAHWWPLYALVLTIQLVHTVYWTNARMRAPLVPVISLFAVACLRRKSESTGSEQFT